MPSRDGQVLQLAVAVGHADRADVVALGEEQLDDHPPVFAQPLGVGLDLHALGDLRGAGRQQLGGCRRPRPGTAGRRRRRRRRRDGRASGSRCPPRSPPRGSSGRSRGADQLAVDRERLDRGHDHRLRQSVTRETGRAWRRADPSMLTVADDGAPASSRSSSTYSSRK